MSFGRQEKVADYVHVSDDEITTHLEALKAKDANVDFDETKKLPNNFVTIQKHDNALNCN